MDTVHVDPVPVERVHAATMPGPASEQAPVFAAESKYLFTEPLSLSLS